MHWHQISWNWSYRQVWAAIWVLGLEPGSSGRAASALNHWAISPAPDMPDLNDSCLLLMVLSWSELVVLSSEGCRIWWAATLDHGTWHPPLPYLFHLALRGITTQDFSVKNPVSSFSAGKLQIKESFSLLSVAFHYYPNDLHRLCCIKLTVNNGKTYF